METKELITKIKQKRKERKQWYQILNTMWDSRKSYKEAKDLVYVDYFSKLTSRGHQTYEQHLWDQIDQLKKKL